MLRSTSVESTLSDSKPASDRLRAHSREGERAAEDRFRGASLAVGAEPAVQAKPLGWQPKLPPVEVDSVPSAPLKATEEPAGSERVEGPTPPVPETRMPPGERQESASAWSLQLIGDSSEERALTEYRNLQEKFPAILGARPPIVIKRQLGGRGLARWYQVRVDEHSRDAADALCSRLRSAGGECLVLSN